MLHVAMLSNAGMLTIFILIAPHTVQKNVQSNRPSTCRLPLWPHLALRGTCPDKNGIYTLHNLIKAEGQRNYELIEERRRLYVSTWQHEILPMVCKFINFDAKTKLLKLW